MNSFDLVGQETELAEVDFWLERDYGRNRRDPGAAWVVVPIIGTFLLCIVAMASTFVVEDAKRQKDAAGGFQPSTEEATTYGKSGNYTPL